MTAKEEIQVALIAQLVGRPNAAVLNALRVVLVCLVTVVNFARKVMQEMVPIQMRLNVDNVKQAIVAASELDTRLVMRPLRNTERVLNNPAVERLLAKEIALGADLKFEDIIDEVAGIYPKVHGLAGAWHRPDGAAVFTRQPTWRCPV